MEGGGVVGRGRSRRPGRRRMEWWGLETRRQHQWSAVADALRRCGLWLIAVRQWDGARVPEGGSRVQGPVATITVAVAVCPSL